MTKARVREWHLTWAVLSGAGDENRTRTVSLGTSFRVALGCVTCAYGAEAVSGAGSW
jgi:hypothetical protein